MFVVSIDLFASLTCYSPGNYEMAGKPYVKIQWHQSFGGTPINLPEVSVHSTIMKNTNKV